MDAPVRSPHGGSIVVDLIVCSSCCDGLLVQPTRLQPEQPCDDDQDAADSCDSGEQDAVARAQVPHVDRSSSLLPALSAAAQSKQMQTRAHSHCDSVQKLVLLSCSRTSAAWRPVTSGALWRGVWNDRAGYLLQNDRARYLDPSCTSPEFLSRDLKAVRQ